MDRYCTHPTPQETPNRTPAGSEPSSIKSPNLSLDNAKLLLQLFGRARSARIILVLAVLVHDARLDGALDALGVHNDISVLVVAVAVACDKGLHAHTARRVSVAVHPRGTCTTAATS